MLDCDLGLVPSPHQPSWVSQLRNQDEMTCLGYGDNESAQYRVPEGSPPPSSDPLGEPLSVLLEEERPGGADQNAAGAQRQGRPMVWPIYGLWVLLPSPSLSFLLQCTGLGASREHAQWREGAEGRWTSRGTGAGAWQRGQAGCYGERNGMQLTV